MQFRCCDVFGAAMLPLLPSPLHETTNVIFWDFLRSETVRKLSKHENNIVRDMKTAPGRY